MSATMATTVNRLLLDHERLTSDIAELHIERGQTQQASIVARAQTYEALQSQGVSATAAREAAQVSAARFDAEAADLTGRIDSLRAQLHHLELRLTYEAGD